MPVNQEHAEGAFYVWSQAEIEGVLGADADFFCAHYGVKPAGNVAHDPQGEFTGKNILRQRQSLVVTAREHGLEIEAASTRLLDCLERMRRVRATRPRPQLDDKVITAWNGLMISALAKGAQVLGEPEHLTAATRAALFIQRELYDPATGVLYRSWREGRSDIAGFAEDYAYLIQGLLDLYETGFEIQWLQWAEKLQAKMDELFWDPRGGGYFNSRADDPTVIVRLKEDYDGAEPAPNSVAALNLVRLEWMIGNERVGRTILGEPQPDGSSGGLALPYGRRAELLIETFRPQWSRAPQALPQMLVALEMLLAAPRTVVLAGDPAAADFKALVAVLPERLGRSRVLLCADGGAGQDWLGRRRAYLAEMKPGRGGATAFVCENFTCSAPAHSPDELRNRLGST